MKTMIKAAGIAASLALAGCGGGADDRAADNIEAAAENRADALEAQADLTSNRQLREALEEQADNIEDMGERAADRADDRDDARVEGQFNNAM